MPTATKTTTLTSPQGLSLFSTEQRQLERNRKIADLLEQQALTPDEGKMVSGWYVPPSPMQGVARLAQAIMATRQRDDADQRENDLVQRQRQFLSEQGDEFVRATTPRPAAPEINFGKGDDRRNLSYIEHTGEEAPDLVRPAEPAYKPTPADYAKALTTYLTNTDQQGKAADFLVDDAKRRMAVSAGMEALDQFGGSGAQANVNPTQANTAPGMLSTKTDNPPSQSSITPAGVGSTTILTPQQRAAYSLFLQTDPAKAAQYLGEISKRKLKEQKVLKQGDNFVTANVFEDGTTETVPGYLPAEKLNFQDTGSETVGFDPLTGKDVARFKNTQSPNNAATNATTRYIHATPSGSAVLASQQGRIPPGYRVSADGTRLEAIPGGPADTGKALPNPAVKELSTAGTAVENSNRLTKSFKDEYGGKTILGDMSNTFGRLFGDTTGQAQWWQDMDTLQNQTRHELFGSALTKTELAAWEKTSIAPRMSSEQIRQNLQRRQEIEARAASKLARAYVAAGYNKEQIRELLGSAAQYIENPAPPAGGTKGAGSGAKPRSWQEVGYQSAEDAIAEAQDAIRRGAPKAAVQQRLQSLGIDPTFLGK